MKTIDWASLSPPERARALARPRRRADPELIKTVAAIFDDVEREGAAAVERWALRIDRAAPRFLALDSDVVGEARRSVGRENLAALELAARNVAAYHEATRPEDVEITLGGAVCRRAWRPIPACGLYAPGGSAPLFSTLLMLALPARAAGVPRRIAVTPPGRDGSAHPMMIAAADLCGLDGLWLAGGAQAIAALAFGALLPKADKIFGPGNAYVAEAKRLASARGLAASDLPAGPSELMVIADEGADPAVIAADLLAQAEHDADAQVLFATNSPTLAARVKEEVANELAGLPRAAVAAKALEQSSAIIVRDVEEAAEIANAYAPEHLALHVEDADGLAARIDNAGAIFVGAASAEAFGDYICGPSHVLPTDCGARAWSGVTTASFMKSVSIQKLSGEAARSLAAATARLARAEGLEAHARSAEQRR